MLLHFTINKTDLKQTTNLCCHCLFIRLYILVKLGNIFLTLDFSFSFPSSLISPIRLSFCCHFFWFITASSALLYSYPNILSVHIFLSLGLSPLCCFICFPLFFFHNITPLPILCTPFPSFTSTLRLSQFQMSWLPSCWVTRQTLAPWWRWSLGDASSTDPSACAYPFPRPGRRAPVTLGRGTPLACACCALS